MTASRIDVKKIIVHHIEPAMADVASGVIPRPRERREGENAIDWLRQTPAFLSVSNRADAWKPYLNAPTYLGFKPAQYLGLGDLTELFVLKSLALVLLAVNPDGTRYALLDLADVLADAWARLDRQSQKQSQRARGKSGPKPKLFDQLSPSQQWRRKQKEKK